MDDVVQWHAESGGDGGVDGRGIDVDIVARRRHGCCTNRVARSTCACATLELERGDQRDSIGKCPLRQSRNDHLLNGPV